MRWSLRPNKFRPILCVSINLLTAVSKKLFLCRGFLVTWTIRNNSKKRGTLAYILSCHVTYVTHVTRVTHRTHDTQVADRPKMCHIFEKVMVQGPQKQCSQVSDVQIHKYKYTITQIHKYKNTQIHQYSAGKSCRLASTLLLLYFSVTWMVKYR